MLLLVAVLLIIMLLLVILVRKRRTTATTTVKIDKYKDVPVDDILNDDNIDTNSGTSKSCVQDDLELADISYDAPVDCLVKPINGVCIFDDLELVNGCCKLIKNENSEETEAAISITTVIVTMFATDAIFNTAVSRGSQLVSKPLLKIPAIRNMAANIISKTTGQSLAKVKAKLLATATGKASTKAASKAATKAAAALATKAATKAAWRIGVAAGMKASAKATMVAVKASMGPGAWAMLAFDAVSIGLDILDPQGYSTFMSNKYLKDMRDYTEFSLYEGFANTDYGWPIIFDVKSMYFDEFVAAYETAKIPFIKQAMMDTIKCKTLAEQLDIGAWFGEYTQRVLQYLNKDPKKRDEKIYQKMAELLGYDSENIKLYPFLSTEKTVGISLSAKGVDVWNKLSDADRIEKINESDPDAEPITEDIFKDFRLVMANTYRVPDNPPDCRKPHKLIIDHIIQTGKEVASFYSGGKVDTTECVPVMNDKTFPREVPMYVLPFSEDICLHGTDGLVKDTTGACGDYEGEYFGVTWNPNTNLCNYTRSYCDRMGLNYSHKTKDCELYPGQDEAELFLPTGTTITRNVMRYGISIMNCDSEEMRKAKGYPDVHTCRLGETTMIGNEVKKYSAIDACKSDTGGYRNADECMAARSLQAIASTAMYFVPGGFLLKMFAGDCDLQWAQPMIEGIVDAANATGEFFEDDFVDFFEDDFTDFFEDDLNPANW